MLKPLIFAVSTLGLVACFDQTGSESISDAQSDGTQNDNQNPVDGNQGSNVHDDIMTGSISLAPEKMKKSIFYFSNSLSNLQNVEGYDDAEYKQEMDQLLSGEGFTDRLVAIFEDKLMSDKYVSSNDRDGAIDLYNNNDFKNRKWYDSEFEDQNTIKNCVRDLTNDALANASLELVRHVINGGQPFSEILTADYMMVNYYSAKALDAQLLGGSDFKELNSPVCMQTNSGEIVNSISFDPTDFRPARIEHEQQRYSDPIAHAGILSDVVFLNRYPTTDTNRNRHRARIVMEYFLDFDILSIDKDRTIEADDSINSVPTMENPNCTICHNMMDPIASTFRSRNASGRMIPVELNRGDNAWNLDDILVPGYLGQTAPEETIESYSLLPWLAQNIVSDVRFPRAMIKTLYKGLYGALPDRTIESAEDYSEFETLITDSITAFTSSNMDIREAAKVMIEHEMWANAQSKDQTHSNLKRRLLTPEILNRKLEILTGNKWEDLESKSREIMFGGVDSDSVTERLVDPNGIYSKMQNRMAVEMACKSVASDFALPETDRKLFPYVSADTLPKDSDGNFDSNALQAIKENIQFLHQHLLNEPLSLSDQELLFTYQLFMDTQSNGLERLINRDDYDPKPLTELHAACGIKSDHPALGNMIGNNSNATELRSISSASNCLSVDGNNILIQSCTGEMDQTWITQNNKVVWGGDTSMCATATALENGGNFELAACDSEDYLQKWEINGALLNNGKFAADLSRGNVHVWTTHGGANQMWSIDGTDTRSEINQDKGYVIRAWMAVITYLLSDALFIYE